VVTATDIMNLPDVRSAVDAHAMAWFPKECCGLLVTGPNGHAAVLTRNGIDEAHATAPTEYERTGETGYQLDPAEIVASEKRGEALVAIFHSHCRVGAYFSDEDKRRALTPWDEPWFPEVDYVVLDAQDDGVRDFKVFHWSEDAGDFIQR
jgi:[CysO sulfur-carrier protein]-S-L-cysteine hydrolase